MISGEIRGQQGRFGGSSRPGRPVGPSPYPGPHGTMPFAIRRSSPTSRSHALEIVSL